MAYDFIGLVNDVNRRLNEVELTTANFAGAQGYYNLTKDAVNASIRHIHQEEFEWPWNHREAVEVLTPGEVRYSMPYDSKTVNLNTFRLTRDTALNVDTRKLKIMPYEEYLDKYADYEYNSSTSIRSVPTYVSRAPSNELIIFPSPNKAYVLRFRYFLNYAELLNYDDQTRVPSTYDHVLIAGAMYHMYLFRDNSEMAGIAQQEFMAGIKEMQTLLLNKYASIEDTRVSY